MSRLQAVNDPRQKLNTTGTFATLGAATLYDGEEAQQRPPPIAISSMIERSPRSLRQKGAPNSTEVIAAKFVRYRYGLLATAA